MKYRIPKGTKITRVDGKKIRSEVIYTERDCVYSDDDRITEYKNNHYYRFTLPAEALPYTYISVLISRVKHENGKA